MYLIASGENQVQIKQGSSSAGPGGQITEDMIEDLLVSAHMYWLVCTQSAHRPCQTVGGESIRGRRSTGIRDIPRSGQSNTLRSPSQDIAPSSFSASSKIFPLNASFPVLKFAKETSWPAPGRQPALHFLPAPCSSSARSLPLSRLQAAWEARELQTGKAQLGSLVSWI